MERRYYYSTRTGKISAHWDLPTLKRLFLAVYAGAVDREHLQELLGKDCVDDPDAFGTAGRDVADYVLRRVRKEGLWPIHEWLPHYTEDDLFDMIEFLYDHVSQGVEGWAHNFNGCGMHYNSFDPAPARLAFRSEVNELLADFGDGYALSESGEIEHVPEAGLDKLVTAALPTSDPTNVDDRVRVAIKKYHNRSSTLEDRRDAVRRLVEVLEFLRPSIKEVFQSRDEAALFEIANNFAVRHHNQRQRSNYDPNIWVSWMFYFYLATIHAALRLMARGANTPSGHHQTGSA